VVFNKARDDAAAVASAYISSPNQCLLFAAHAYTTTTCFAVVSILYHLLVHGQVTIIFVVLVGLSVYLFVCTKFFSAVFDPISIKLGHMLYVWV